MTHNHPDGLMTASSSDVEFADEVQKKIPFAKFFVYRRVGSYLQYDRDSYVPENRLNTVKSTLKNEEIIIINCNHVA